jgi:hypothetical protein
MPTAGLQRQPRRGPLRWLVPDCGKSTKTTSPHSEVVIEGVLLAVRVEEMLLRRVAP